MTFAVRSIVGAAAAALLLGSAAPALAQYRDRDITDPRLGRELGNAVEDMVGVLGRAVEDARHNVRMPGDGGYRDYRDIRSRSDAVDACSMAAEDEARRVGYDARVTDIDDVDSYRDDSWDIEGTIETGYDYRDRDRDWDRGDRRDDERRFTCSIRYGEIAHLYVDGQDYAYRY